MLLASRFAFVLCLQLLIVGSITAQTVTVESLEQPTSLAGQWRFSPGDDLSWAEITFDDQLWDQVAVPALSPEGYPNHSGMAWYRLSLQLDLQEAAIAEQTVALAIALGAVESAYEVYAGGQKLGGIGQLPPESLPVYNQHGIYDIPASAIDQQGQLVLALRVWSHETARNAGPYEGPFLIGSKSDLTRMATVDSLAPGMLMATVYLAIGLYHLFIALRNPSMREFFWFGWFTLALSVYSMETSQWRYNIDIPFLWHLKIEYTVLYLIPFLCSEVLTRIVKILLNLPLRLFKYVFLLLALTVAIVPTIDIHYLTLPVFQNLTAAWALYIAILMGWHGLRGNREAGILAGVALIVLLAVINDIFVEGALFGTTDTIYLVFALTIVLMAVLMANHYTATLSKLELSVEERTGDLLQTNKKLEEANSIKEQFLANMSHELRTPMNAIIGLTKLGLQTDLSEKQQDYLNKVDASAANLLGIIDSVLDFSRLQAGELQCVNHAFDLRQLLEELEVATGEQISQRDELNIRFQYDARIPVSLSGDAGKLANVLRNLISNALKFTPAGDITIDARLTGRDDAKASVLISVTDCGIGMTESQQENLFEGFSQLDSSFNRAYGGTGLGLTTANELVKLMGGEIGVSSREGEGSCFSFRLEFPYEQSIVSEAATRVKISVDRDRDLTPIQGALILVVDDSDINLQIASEILQQAGFRVENAHDGQQAVDMIAEKNYDCVLMDLQMPIMDGFMATETIRAQPRFKDLPILAMTANFSAEDRTRASQSGMNAHIPKPIDQQQLFDYLLEWIAPGERKPVLATPADEASSQPALPDELPGLHVREGLGRVGGNSRLYLKLLQDMSREYLDTAGKIRNLMSQQDKQQASQLAHKLRGIANNLGAIQVGRLSGDIEQSLKEDLPFSGSTLIELATELSSLSDSIDQLLAIGSSTTFGDGLDRPAISALVEQLEQEITESNPAAIDTSENLLSGMDESVAGIIEIKAVTEALDVFDFASAEKHLAAARQLLD